MNYQAIYNDRQLPEYSGLTPAQFAEARNDKSVVRLNHIDKSIVNNYISNHNLNLKLRAVTMSNDSAVDVPIAAAGGLTLRLVAFAGLDWLLADTGKQTNPQNTNLQNLIGILQQAGVFTADEVDGFWELFKTYHSPAEIEYGADITEADVVIADRLPLQESFSALRQQAAGGYNRVVDAIDAGEASGVVPTFAALVDEFAGEPV